MAEKIRYKLINERLNWVSELPIIREYLGHPQIINRLRFAHFLVVIDFLFFPFYAVHPMLPASLDCPFLIVHSIFSNVYLKLIIQYYNVQLCVLQYYVIGSEHVFMYIGFSSAIIF